MTNSDKPIGIMDGGFFVSKSTLIEWINSLLSVKIEKVEQCATGVIYCLLLDAYFPHSIPIKRINFHPKRDYDYIPNYKILQKAFDNLEIQKQIEVDKLIRGKLQDNLEFLQWFKSFLSTKSVSSEFDPISRRAEVKGPMPPWAKGGPKQAVKQSIKTTTTKPIEQPSPGLRFKPNKPSVDNNVTSVKKQRQMPPTPEGVNEINRLKEEIEKSAIENKNLSMVNEELKIEVDGLERERNFFFNKLRRVEIELDAINSSSHSIPDVVKCIQSVLFKEDDVSETEPIKDSIAHPFKEYYTPNVENKEENEHVVTLPSVPKIEFTETIPLDALKSPSSSPNELISF